MGCDRLTDRLTALLSCEEKEKIARKLTSKKERPCTPGDMLEIIPSNISVLDTAVVLGAFVGFHANETRLDTSNAT